MVGTSGDHWVAGLSVVGTALRAVVTPDLNQRQRCRRIVIDEQERGVERWRGEKEIVIDEVERHRASSGPI